MLQPLLLDGACWRKSASKRRSGGINTLPSSDRIRAESGHRYDLNCRQYHPTATVRCGQASDNPCQMNSEFLQIIE